MSASVRFWTFRAERVANNANVRLWPVEVSGANIRQTGSATTIPAAMPSAIDATRPTVADPDHAASSGALGCAHAIPNAMPSIVAACAHQRMDADARSRRRSRHSARITTHAATLHIRPWVAGIHRHSRCHRANAPAPLPHIASSASASMSRVSSIRPSSAPAVHSSSMPACEAADGLPRTTCTSFLHQRYLPDHRLRRGGRPPGGRDGDAGRGALRESRRTQALHDARHVETRGAARMRAAMPG